jgi:hypothetical protein
VNRCHFLLEHSPNIWSCSILCGGNIKQVGIVLIAYSNVYTLYYTKIAASKNLQISFWSTA